MEPTVLKSIVDAYNKMCETEEDTEFGKPAKGQLYNGRGFGREADCQTLGGSGSQRANPCHIFELSSWILYGNALFPEFCRRNAALFFKQAAEVQRIVIANDFSDFRNIAGRGFQKALGVGHPKGEKVLGRC